MDYGKLRIELADVQEDLRLANAQLGLGHYEQAEELIDGAILRLVNVTNVDVPTTREIAQMFLVPAPTSAPSSAPPASPSPS